MRKFFQRFFRKHVIYLTNKYSSRPEKGRVHTALTDLYAKIQNKPGKKGPSFDFGPEDKIVILSDQHKGSRDYADDFALAEKNYLAALNFYNLHNYWYVNLGDSED